MKIHRGGDRHHWRDETVDSWQSFPATGNHDLAANAHGVLMVHNDDTVEAGGGFDTHQHRNAEILTWVLEGSLVHRDSQGNEGIITPGLIQRMSAGSGIRHSEHNASSVNSGQRLRVVQMWLPPHADDIEPGYAEADFTEALATGEAVVVASGLPRHAGTSAIPFANRFAALHVARPYTGNRISLPAAAFGHLYVARGRVGVDVVEAGAPAHAELDTGDALRLTDSGELTVSAPVDAEVLYWEMHGSFDL